MSARKNRTTGFRNSVTHQSDEACGSSVCGTLGLTETLKWFKRRRFSAKEVIYRESDLADKVFVILSGMIKLLSYLPNGRARIVRLHGHSNNWLGLEGLVGQPYEHNAVAVSDVEVAYVAINKLQLLERDNLWQYCQILKQGYKNLAQADRWITEFSTGGIKPRVARLLDYLSTLEYSKSSNMVELLTVYEMADILGVTPESVSRILAEFKRNETLQKQDSLSGESYEIDFQKLQYVARQ